VQARADFMQHVVSKGKIFYANRHSTSIDEQSIPAFRFTETGSSAAASAAAFRPGEKPPLENYLLWGALNTPIGLGITRASEDEDPVQWIMRGLIVYLRHGALVTHGDAGPFDPPDTEGGRNAMRCIRMMYPITPMELGEGFIIGRERILTAISLDRVWQKDSKPVVSIFDIDGLPVPADERCEITATENGWRIQLQLNDWAEYCVIQ
jgi:hypothetical protein